MSVSPGARTTRRRKRDSFREVRRVRRMPGKLRTWAAQCRASPCPALDRRTHAPSFCAPPFGMAEWGVPPQPTYRPPTAATAPHGCAARARSWDWAVPRLIAPRSVLRCGERNLHSNYRRRRPPDRQPTSSTRALLWLSRMVAHGSPALRYPRSYPRHVLTPARRHASRLRDSRLGAPGAGRGDAHTRGLPPQRRALRERRSVLLRPLCASRERARSSTGGPRDRAPARLWKTHAGLTPRPATPRTATAVGAS